MAASCTHVVWVRFTSNERALIEGIATVRGMSTSDVIRELMGLDREDEQRSTDRRLRLVSA
jgi:hypothetical protein